MSLLAVLLVASLLLTATVTAKKAMDMDAYNKRTGAKYLAEIAKKESVVTLKSGMLIEVITPSSARNAVSPTVSDTCDVTYRCVLPNWLFSCWILFSSSYLHLPPSSFPFSTPLTCGHFFCSSFRSFLLRFPLLHPSCSILLLCYILLPFCSPCSATLELHSVLKDMRGLRRFWQ